MSAFSDAIFTSPDMAEVFSGPIFVQRMLDFEAALAGAQARAGVIPRDAADAIAAQCRADRFDTSALFKIAAEAGTPAIPLVRRLTELVAASTVPGTAGSTVPGTAGSTVPGTAHGTAQIRGYVHWGATSQDVVDTATMLQIRDGLDLLIAGLTTVGSACAALAERYRHTPMAGRTLLQHAVPITFGLKAARWLAMTARLIRRLREVRAHALAVQLGGAAGTLAAMGDQGLRIMELVAEALHLGVPELPWHTERDRIAEIAGALGMVAGSMGKIAADIALLSQTEVAEASAAAAATTGRSTAMPHKRNPVEATNASACARLALGVVPAVLSASVQEHERAAGGWQSEWHAVPELFRLTSGAVYWVQRAVGTLEIDADRMRVNIDLTHGLIMAEALTMALAPKLGRDDAYQIVQQVADQAAARGVAFHDAAAASAEIRAALTADEMAHAFDVSGYLGSTDLFIDRALRAFRSLTGASQ